MADFYHESFNNNNTNYNNIYNNNNTFNLNKTTTTTTTTTTTDNDDKCFNVTELEAVTNYYGQWFLIILYSLTSLLALLGNLTVIIVEIYGNESANNIRKYLINLAISDIIIGVLCVPFTYTDFMLGQWIFPHWLCPTAQFVQLLSVFVTSLTLTFIGIERYMATLHPFSSIHHWLECHTHYMLLLTWIFGATYAYIPFENTATRSFQLPNDNKTIYYECTYDNNVTILKLRLFMASNIILTFLLPLIVLIFSYSAIMRKLIIDEKRFRKSSSSTNTNNNVVQNQNQNNYKKQKLKKQNFINTENSNNSIITNHSKNVLLELQISSSKNNNTDNISDKSYENDNNNNNNNNNKLTTTTSTLNTEIINQQQQQQLSYTSQIDLRKSTPFNHRSKTIKMMFVVILLYGICWMPIKLYQFLNDYGILSYCSEHEFYAIVCLYFICHWMAMANSFVNPIIYSFMSKSFWNDFRKITNTFRQTFSKNINRLSIKTTTTSTTQV